MTFDNEGRLNTQIGSTPRTFTWDGKARLKTLTQAGTTETYRYDPSDHRIGRSGGTLGTLDYYLEGEHLESVEQAGVLQEKYFRGSTIDELVAGYLNQSGKLVPILFQHDSVMSVVAQTKANGGTLATYAYRPFGDNMGMTGTPVGRLKYTGREDDGTGLYYYRARYYDRVLGQFVSEDPKKFGAGMNFYSYADNNPIGGNDPSGLDTQITIGYTHTAAPGLSHQVVILTDTVSGAQYATRAGPECFLCGGLGAGSITAVSGSYDSKFKDPPSSVYTTQPVGVIQRDFADSVSNAINFRDVTNTNQIPYWPLGPNSNSYASTFVQSLTGTRPEPIVTAPGANLGTPSSALNYTPAPLVNASLLTTPGANWGTSSPMLNYTPAPLTNPTFSMSPSIQSNYDNSFWTGSQAGTGFLPYPSSPNFDPMPAVYSK
jgi:RHS repeat-associated protein